MESNYPTQSTIKPNIMQGINKKKLLIIGGLSLVFIIIIVVLIKLNKSSSNNTEGPNSGVYSADSVFQQDFLSTNDDAKITINFSLTDTDDGKKKLQFQAGDTSGEMRSNLISIVQQNEEVKFTTDDSFGSNFLKLIYEKNDTPDDTDQTFKISKNNSVVFVANKMTAGDLLEVLVVDPAGNDVDNQTFNINFQ